MAVELQIPWDWYIVRASALIGFLLLYVAVFAGTVSCLPGIRRFFLRLRSLNFHCWISLQALVFAAIHGAALLFDKIVPFNLADVLVPFHSAYQPFLVALGTISFYLMVILVVSSYARRYISQKFWRGLHFLNIVLYVFSVAHAFFLGTDLQSGLLRNVFIWANVFLILLLIYNIIYGIWSRIRKREVVCALPESNSHENLRQSDSAFRPQRSDQNFRRRI